MLLVALLGLLIGFIKPSIVIRWGGDKTRGNVALTYGLLLVVSVILTVIGAPSDATAQAESASNAQEEQQAGQEKDGIVETVTERSAIETSFAGAKNTVLFKQYKYGQPISEFPIGSLYEDCSSDVGQSARCAGEVEFMGEKYSTTLVFSDSKLSSVSLVTDFSVETYGKLMASLPKNGFNLALMQGKSDRLDLIETASKGGQSQSDFISKISAFESVNINGGQLAYAFVELPRSELNKYKSTVDALMKMPSKTRELDLTVFEDDESAYIDLTFTLPKLALQELSASGEVSKEAF